MNEDLTDWTERLEAAIEAEGISSFDRVFVLSACESTQDAAKRLCASKPGAVVVAGRQTAGRGRLGRPWVQKGGLGIAVTFVLPHDRLDAGTLSIAAGVAAVEAAGSLLDQAQGPRVGLRWPNDLVERGRGRKVAGILVERSESLMLVGVGMNVLHRESDWGEDLGGRACSLAELGATATRLEVVRRLMCALEGALALKPEALAEAWGHHDTLLGKRAEFAYNGSRYQGVVDAISPTHEIVIRTPSGDPQRLPCMQTSLVRWE